MQNKFIAIPIALVAATLLSGAFLISSHSFATSDNANAVDDVSITVPVSCSMEGTGMNSHNANIVNGTYQADIGSTTLKAFCNDDEGFAIYANGYTEDTLGDNKLIGNVTRSVIETGTATSTPNPDVSNWAMKLIAPSSPTPTYPIALDNGFGSYSNVPSTYTKVAHRDSGTDIGQSAEGATLTTTYAAYISKTQQADSYSGQVIYTLVHPASETPAQPVACDPGKICYNPNTATALGEMGKQTPTSSQLINGIPLWAANFKRDGYGFAGWNDKFDYSGNFYGPNETITAPADIQANGLSLYAVWIKSAGTIQNWNGCPSLAQGTTTALTDERDGNTYAIAKLADNKCWMIENLRLADKDSSNNDINLSSTNTHNPSTPLNNSWYYKNQQGTLTTSNHLSATSDPASRDTAWCLEDSSNCNDQSMLTTDNTTLFTNNTSTNYSTSNNVYSYGNYYNWYSATAGHGIFSKSSGNTSGDICPVGWHLSIGDTIGEFYVLNTAVNSDNTGSTASKGLRSYPNNFIYSGYVTTSSIFARGGSYGFGEYWSSSANYSTGAYYLRIYNDDVLPGTDYGYKYYGRTIRCIAGV